MSVSHDTGKTAARNGESAAGRRMAELFDEHARMVFAVCRRYLRDVDDAEDVRAVAGLAPRTAFAACVAGLARA